MIKKYFFSSAAGLLFFSQSLIAQAPGSFDFSFKSFAGAESTIDLVEPTPDGGYFLGGGFTNFNRTVISDLVKIKADNTVDGSFTSGFINDNSYSLKDICPSIDGEYFAVGAFVEYQTIPVSGILKFHADGSIDSTFNDSGSGFGFISGTYARHVQQFPDGSILVCGDFTTYNGSTVPKIIRLNPDGTRDLTFNPSLTSVSAIYDFELLPDGNIIIAGKFSNTYAGITKYNIEKLHADGSVDSIFHVAGVGNSTNTSYYIRSLEMTADGKLLAGGYFNTFNGVTKLGIVKITVNGEIDAGFLPANTSTGKIYDIEIRDGNIFIVGEAITIEGNSCGYAVLNSDGSRNTSFPYYSVTTSILDIDFINDGDIILTGFFSVFNNRVENAVVRLNPDGLIDELHNYDNGANNSVYNIATKSDGSVFIAGAFTLYDKYSANHIAKLQSDGTFDTSYHIGTGFNDITRITYLQPNGRLIVAGDFTSFNGTTKNHLARLMPDGTLDPLFSVSTGPVTYSTSSIQDIGLMSDNKIIVAGTWTTFAGLAKPNIVKLFSNGTPDLSFAAVTISGIKTVLIQPDNKIILGGSFTTVNGITKKGMCRLNVNGTLDATFNTGAGGSVIYDCAFTPDGKIIIVGTFSTYDGIAAGYIARLLPNGSIDTSFHTGTGAGSTIKRVHILPDGKIAIDGSFATYNGITVGRSAILFPDGSLDMSFTDGAEGGLDSDPACSAAQADGDLLFGNYQTTYSNYFFDRVCRVNGPGCSDKYDTTYASIFTGETYTLPDGSIVSTSGTYITSINYLYDCDSIYTTILNVVPPPCTAPTDIVVFNITSSSAKFTWGSVATATQYNLWYRKTGVAAWTKKNVTTTTKNLTGLSPSTTYEYKLRSNCGGTYSPFSTMSTFTTLPLKESNINQNTNLFVYPDPNKGDFIIDAGENAIGSELIIRSITGNVIYKKIISAEDGIESISLTDVAPGVYVLTIHSPESNNSIHFIIN